MPLAEGILLTSSDRANFDTLARAFAQSHVALVEVLRVSDQTPVAAICCVSFIDGDYLITPFAILVEGDPYKHFAPPRPEGGFYVEAQT